MGIVKISDDLHQEIRIASASMSRSINSQAEFWIKIGLLAELNPNMTYNELARKLILTQSNSIKELINE